MLKIIAKSSWDFILFEDDDKKILTVVFYDMGIDYTRSFYLNKDELSTDITTIAHLSENIRNNYLKYKDREITPSITSETDF